MVSLPKLDWIPLKIRVQVRFSNYLHTSECFIADSAHTIFFFFRVFKSVESTEAYIEVRDLTMSGYTFKIYSVNQENSSIDHAEVVLPPEKTRKQPLNHILNHCFLLNIWRSSFTASNNIFIRHQFVLKLSIWIQEKPFNRVTYI